ncbi:MAG: acyl-CoA reductase [Bacteroidetes bacterium]|nr:acyl-CoA reductase [Bacteroidota bacterium]
MDLKKRLESLIKLGDYIKSGLRNDEFKGLFEEAYIHNNWFTEEFCRLSFSSAANYYLNKEKLDKWVSSYELRDFPEKKKIGLILAGNIPLVGIHDMLSVYVSGNCSQIKVSSKDRVLTKFLLEKLLEIETESKSYFQFDDQLKGMDALIATGSNNSARYFEYYFSHCPHVIRRNRNSIAVLNGKESEKDIKLLEDDVFNFFGLGCRSVSKIFIPADYHLNILLDVFNKYHYFIHHNKYYNNYIYHKSIFTLNSDIHLDNGYLLLKESESIHSPLAVLFFERYDQLGDVEESIEVNKDQVQAIVSNEKFSLPTLAFGNSQFPELWDYADDVDIMSFINNI